MADLHSRFARVVRDLRRRKVFRAGAAYAVIAWLAVEVASVILDAYGADPAILRALIIVAGAGFPVAMILAWTFDITSHGLVRTPAADELAEEAAETRRGWRWRSFVSFPLIVAIGVGAWWLWTTRLADSGSAFLRRHGLGAPPVVGVVPLHNLTGQESLAWLGNGIANLVRDNLTQSRYLAVVSAARMHRLMESAERAQLPAAAGQAGIRYLLIGEMLAAPGGLTVTVRLADVERDLELANQRLDELTPETLLAASTPIATLVKQGLGVPRKENVDVYAADFAVDNMAAYESYVAGLEYFVRFKYPDAERAFQAALELAPDFAMARYRLAHAQATSGRTEEALQNIRLAAASDYLADREARYIAAAEAWFSRRYGDATTTYVELLESYPYEVEARQNLAFVLRGQDRYEEAIQQALILTAQEPGNRDVWSMLGDSYLRLGRFDEAQPALEQLVALAPDSANALFLLGDAHFYNREFEAARERYLEALAIDPDFHFATTSIAFIDALEGRLDAAEQGLRALAENTAALPRYRIDAAFELASILRAGGRFQEAATVLAALEPELAAEQIRAAMAYSVRGLCAMETGDPAAAAELIDLGVDRSPRSPPTRYLFARGLLELDQGNAGALYQTAQQILAGALPAGNPDRTEDKAAAYLKGLAALARDDTDQAVTLLSRAVDLSGYEYSLYRLGLARALLAAGRLDDAREAARLVQGQRDIQDVRLDLELDRTRAVLLEAQIEADAGNHAEAAVLAARFLQRWDRAEPGLPDLELARQLGGGD